MLFIQSLGLVACILLAHGTASTISNYDTLKTGLLGSPADISRPFQDLIYNRLRVRGDPTKLPYARSAPNTIRSVVSSHYYDTTIRLTVDSVSASWERLWALYPSPPI